MSDPKSILLLTDESSACPGLADTLRLAAGGRAVRVVTKPAEALDLTARGDCEAILCYFHNGIFESVNFLGEVWKRQPNVARFLLADEEVDDESRLRCAFAGHHLLSLPLDPRSLAEALQACEAAQVLVPNERIKLLVSRIRAFPSEPAVYAEVVREVRSRNPDPARIAQIIGRDVGISAKLLQIVNSPFYGRVQPVSELTEVVLFLGFDLVESIVLSLEAISRFDHVRHTYLTAESVWGHSQRVAELSRRICHQREEGHGERGLSPTAYLGGLLHDIGKLAFARNLEEDYREIIQIARCEKRPLYEIELEAWGVTHADAGAYLLGLWGLPFPMLEAVARHHAAPDSFNAFSPALAVHLAENLIRGDVTLDNVNELYPSNLALAEPLTELGLEPGRQFDISRAGALHLQGA